MVYAYREMDDFVEFSGKRLCRTAIRDMLSVLEKLRLACPNVHREKTARILTNKAMCRIRFQ